MNEQNENFTPRAGGAGTTLSQGGGNGSQPKVRGRVSSTGSDHSDLI